MNSRVAIVKLPKSNSKPKGSVEAAGWGLTNPHQRNLSDILQTVDLKVIDNHTCEKVIDEKLREEYGPELPEFLLHETSFCAFGPMTGGKGTCNVSYLYHILGIGKSCIKFICFFLKHYDKIRHKSNEI